MEAESFLFCSLTSSKPLFSILCFKNPWRTGLMSAARDLGSSWATPYAKCFAQGPVFGLPWGPVSRLPSLQRTALHAFLCLCITDLPVLDP